MRSMKSQNIMRMAIRQNRSLTKGVLLGNSVLKLSWSIALCLRRLLVQVINKTVLQQNLGASAQSQLVVTCKHVSIIVRNQCCQCLKVCEQYYNKGEYKYYISLFGGRGGFGPKMLIFLMWFAAESLEVKCPCKRSEFLFLSNCEWLCKKSLESLVPAHT